MPRPKHSIHSEYQRIGAQELKCRHCAGLVKSADIVRLMRHVAACDSAPASTRQNANNSRYTHASGTCSRKRSRQSSASTYTSMTTSSTALPATPQFSLPRTPFDSETTRSTPVRQEQPGIQQWMDTISVEENNLLSEELADVISSAGLPFSLVEHPNFVAFLN
ncbi:hypothetical protein E4U58_007526 [Claviceps cyperi]|nr:hypothetical protein E4U58_007526 [Claviceps cyperi]